MRRKCTRTKFLLHDITIRRIHCSSLPDEVYFYLLNGDDIGGLQRVCFLLLKSLMNKENSCYTELLFSPITALAIKKPFSLKVKSLVGFKKFDLR